MTDIPPKQTMSANTPEMGGRPPESEPGALVSIHNAALHANPESFPVLKAFQDYLEAERQRARRRVVMLSCFFVALMMVVVAGFLFVGMKLFSHMSKTQDYLLQAALADGRPLAPLPSTADAATPPAPPSSPGVASVSQEVNRLREALATVTRENAQLRTGLAARPVPAQTPAAPAAAAATPGTAVARPQPPAAGMVAATPRRQPLELPARPPSLPPPPGFADATLFVPGAAGADPVPWRIFVPVR